MRRKVVPTPIAPKVDMIAHPPHYTQGDIECIDAMASALGKEGMIAYLRGACFKYTWRMMTKGSPLEDARKLEWYAHELVAMLNEAEVHP